MKELIKIENKKTLKKVGTHDGRFHADEVMATAILNRIFDTEIIRTRDSEILKELEIVYDVGGGEFDHHGVDKVYRENGTPYAACGLIWNQFGKEAIQAEDPSLKEDEIDAIFNYVDRVLIEGIDAQDNGVKTSDEIIPTMNISSVISGFNPPWYMEDMQDEAFGEAVKLGERVLKNTISRKLGIIKAKDFVVSAYTNRKKSEILRLDRYCPWEETLRDIDEEGQVIFVVYPNKDRYTMQTVTDQEGNTRKYLPENWAGKENEALSNITGVQDAIFCHTGRFIAVAGSLDGIMKMADLAIKNEEDAKD